ncbi:MAG TPA: tripartite tricarboxylate transporter substrate binding protein [Burkholderiaceae bacterium]|nr:tripartite tricarboxylate transporter substrate binding protein [Burkholderiaceae bacterium]
MKRSVPKIAQTAAVAFAAALFLPPAHAQPYPSKPIRIVVPFAAGGAVDIVARVVGQRLAEQAGQPVVVENKPGGNANIGADFVARAPPDGYTLLLGANGLAANMTLHKNLPFDTLRDFAPVAGVGYAPLVLVVPATSPAKTLQDFIALARAQRGAMTYGTSGAGSSGHLATELLKAQARFEALHVPYKGGAPALADLVGDRISFMLINPLEAAPHVKSGRLRALAVSGARRLAMLADVPTFNEAGLADFEATVWWGFVAPAKTQRELVTRLQNEILAALKDDGVRDRLVSLGAVVEPMDSAEFGRFLAKEIEKWGRVIKAAGITED